MILGLDVSTSAVGYSLISLNKKYDVLNPVLGFINLEKEKILFDKVEKCVKEFSDMKNIYDVDRIAIEDKMGGFAYGMTNARTLILLASFNALVTYVVQKEFGVSPTHINVNRARSKLGIKLEKGKLSTEEKKMRIFEWVDDKIGNNVVWPMKKLSRGPRKGVDVLRKEAFDMCDAYVISLADFMLSDRIIL